MAGLAVVGGAVHLLHAFQTRRHADFFLDQAHTAKAAGDKRDAIDSYRNYLSISPDDAAARAELGLLLADLGANGEAFRAFEQVLRTDPTRSDVRRQTAKAALAIGRFRDAREHLQGFLLKETPDDPELLEMLGECQAAAGEYLAAARTFESAIEHDPKRIDSYLHLVAVLSRRPEELAKDEAHWKEILPKELQHEPIQGEKAAEKAAEYWLDRMAEANPESSRAI